jgi:hypothetical protein
MFLSIGISATQINHFLTITKFLGHKNMVKGVSKNVSNPDSLGNPNPIKASESLFCYFI